MLLNPHIFGKYIITLFFTKVLRSGTSYFSFVFVSYIHLLMQKNWFFLYSISWIIIYPMLPPWSGFLSLWISSGEIIFWFFICILFNLFCIQTLGTFAKLPLSWFNSLAQNLLITRPLYTFWEQWFHNILMS